jgi:hypothetical protein
MRVNSTQNLEKTALWAGNSPAVISSNYLGTGTPEEAKRSFSLNPPSSSLVAMNISANSSSVVENSNETAFCVVV